MPTAQGEDVLAKVKQLPPIDRLTHWIKERHQVFLKRLAGEKPPWTQDPILQTTYFTNPYRENDRTTIWVRQNIREPLKDDPRVLFAVAAARWFNYIPTMEELGLQGFLLRWNSRKVVAHFSPRRSAGEKIFTGAFMISGGGSKKKKLEHICEEYIQPMWEARKELLEGFNSANSLRNAYECLRLFKGMGSFMAAQVIADLKYTYLLNDAHDWWTWSAPGPGSKRGMGRVLGHPSGKYWLTEINELRKSVLPKLPEYAPELHAQDLQNCCCEWDKYERILWGQGRTKRHYNGVGQ